MRITKAWIKQQLINSLQTGEGIRVKAINMTNGGSHHWWLTGDENDYEIHLYGSGPGWCDQGDDCRIQNIDKAVDKLWEERKYILRY